MKSSVKFGKPFVVWIRSWVAFVFAFLLLGLFWAGCYVTLTTFVAGPLVYLRIGLIGAMSAGALMLIFNEPLVKLSLGARRIKNRSDCPKLWDATIAAMPKTMLIRPRIYLVPSHDMNAMAFGWGIPLMSAVGATQGIVDKLDQDELTAVMAHEVGHIINKDILVSTMMSISVMAMVFAGWLMLRVGPYSSNQRSSSKDSGVAILVLILVGFLLYGFGRILGVILQMFVSRQREYAADAQSAKIMGSSAPLISALNKINGRSGIGSRNTNAALGFMCTADPDPSDMMSTHPSMPKRIQALKWLEM